MFLVESFLLGITQTRNINIHVNMWEYESILEFHLIKIDLYTLFYTFLYIVFLRFTLMLRCLNEKKKQGLLRIFVK